MLEKSRRHNGPTLQWYVPQGAALASTPSKQNAGRGVYIHDITLVVPDRHGEGVVEHLAKLPVALAQLLLSSLPQRKLSMGLQMLLVSLIFGPLGADECSDRGRAFDGSEWMNEITVGSEIQRVGLVLRVAIFGGNLEDRDRIRRGIGLQHSTEFEAVDIRELYSRRMRSG